MDFLAKSLVIPAIYTKFKLITHKFMIYPIKSGDLPWRVSGGSPDSFRQDNIPGSHGISALASKMCQIIKIKAHYHDK
jgi:hypothetical protein